MPATARYPSLPSRGNRLPAFRLTQGMVLGAAVVLLGMAGYNIADVVRAPHGDLPLTAPAGSGQESQPGQFSLAIGQDRQFYLDALPITQDELHAKLAAAATLHPAPRVRIDLEGNTVYPEVVTLLEVCQTQGLRDVGLHTRREP